jgi:hypothetical protein
MTSSQGLALKKTKNKQTHRAIKEKEKDLVFFKKKKLINFYFYFYETRVIGLIDYKKGGHPDNKTQMINAIQIQEQILDQVQKDPIPDIGFANGPKRTINKSALFQGHTMR